MGGGAPPPYQMVGCNVMLLTLLFFDFVAGGDLEGGAAMEAAHGAVGHAAATLGTLLATIVEEGQQPAERTE